MKLDENLPIALYHQLKKLFVQKIQSGEWETHSKIPTERELCEFYRVSRITVRQALDLLKKDGYLYRKQGKGTFITRPKLEQPLQHFYSFSEAIRKMGYMPGNRVLHFSILPCPEGVASRLGLKVNAPVYCIRRLRLADEDPFAVETSYIGVDTCPGMKEEEVTRNGLYNTLSGSFGIQVNEAEETFEAILVAGKEAEVLGVRSDTPGLHLERIAGQNGHAIEFCDTTIRGDRFKYKVVLK